ncbi:MAG TPA: DUF2809 domain-containing protein [Ferruginibacter sp.]|nr:DUF2809 domain-containing protein [Ferruginibacter sp.]HMP21142.1 DUF2809 domain-containing protein [Ferruginibacter sp.]
MPAHLQFKRNYFIFTLLLLVVEVCIAVFVHDRFIRPYFGDVLVVALIYCFIQSFFNFPVIPTATAVLLFAFFIELLQYFNIVNRLGWQNSTLACTVIGTSFAWEDIIAYIAGFSLILIIEKVKLAFTASAIKG